MPKYISHEININLINLFLLVNFLHKTVTGAVSYDEHANGHVHKLKHAEKEALMWQHQHSETVYLHVGHLHFTS